MRLYIDQKILFTIILLCFSCQSTGNKLDNKTQKQLEPIQKPDSQELKYDDHCLKYNPGNVNSIKFSKSNIYYPVSTTIDIATYNFYSESAYLFHFYHSFMQIYREIFNTHQIKVMGNPKYLFLAALENLSKGKYNTAYDQLSEFVEIEKNYERNPKKYFKLGCTVEDLDWLYSHQDHYTFIISTQLKLIIESFSNNQDDIIKTAGEQNHAKVLSEFIELLIELDDTPNTLDTFENIIFIINKYLSGIDIEKNKLLKAPIASFRDYTWERIDILNDSLLISYLNIFYDSYSYILSSQLELSLYKKINYASKIITELDILQMDNEQLLNNELNLYAFCHYFELIQLYDINDPKIDINRLRLKLLSISLDWGYDEIISWVDVIENPVKKQNLFSHIEKIIIKHKEGKIDSSNYYFLYNNLFDQDIFFSVQSNNQYGQSNLLYPDSVKLAIIKEFSMYNSDYDCDEEDICNNIYPRILGYYYDIYEYHSDIIYHKFKNKIIHTGNKPKNSINEGALSLLYALDDIIVLYN